MRKFDCKLKTIAFSFFLISINLIAEDIPSQELTSYLEKRKEAVLLNTSFGFDSKIQLSPKEMAVNEYLTQLKQIPYNTYPAKNFLTEKKDIEETPLYSFLKKMPKGGLLHIHSGSLLNTEWMIRELSTLPDCYVYWEENGQVPKGTFHFYEKDAVPNGFLSTALLRSTLPDFDQILYSLLQIEIKNLSITDLWVELEGWFTRTSGLVHYKPAFIKYYTHSMETFIEDNLQYMELRILDSPTYSLDGVYDSFISVTNTLLEVKQAVQKKHPHFNFKLIFTEFRNSPKNKLLDHLEQAYSLRSLYPDFIIGYDLVGEEDTGAPTLDHIESLLHAKQFEKKYGIDLPYYFHDGESNDPTNTNLYDAVLLKCKRIGHGLNLFHFPYLIEQIKKEDLCIEVCPISNQVLGYVPDLRIHPASGYLKEGVPCILASDDPGLFGYHGMTPDLWEAVLAWDLDLKALKQLCLNSINYSGMSSEEKTKALEWWYKEWNTFIETIH